MPALVLILRLVVDATRGPSVLMRQALLDPVAVEAEFVQQSGPGASKIVNSEGLKWQPLLFRSSDHGGRDPVERRPRHWRVSVISRRKDIARIAGAGFQRDEDVDGLLRQVDVVCLRPLHSFLGYRPDGVLKIDLIPGGILELALPDHRQEEKLHSQPYGRQCRHMLKLTEHDADLRGR